MAVFDGSTIKIPKTNEIIKHFGVWDVRQGDPCPMARISQLFDPLNKMTLNAIISPKSVGERQQAAALMQELAYNSLVLMDRGYPAFWLFKLILSQHAHFYARISRKWDIVRKFINSGKKEKIVEINAAYSSIKQCREIGLHFIRSPYSPSITSPPALSDNNSLSVRPLYPAHLKTH